MICAYRRDEENMPGSKREVKNAKEEGVEFMFNVQPKGIEVNEQGIVTGVKMIKTQLTEADENGRRRAEEVAGSEHVVAADAVLMLLASNPQDGVVNRLVSKSIAGVGSLRLNGRIYSPNGNQDFRWR